MVAAICADRSFAGSACVAFEALDGAGLVLDTVDPFRIDGKTRGTARRGCHPCYGGPNGEGGGGAAGANATWGGCRAGDSVVEPAEVSYHNGATLDTPPDTLI